MDDTKYERIPAAVGTVANADTAKTVAEVTSAHQAPIVWKFFKFLLFLMLACVLVTVALMGTIFYGGSNLIGALGEFVVPKITSDVPIEIPEIHLPEEEVAEIHHRLHEFKHAIHHGNAPPHDLVLTERELNGLICDKGDHYDPHRGHHVHHRHHHNRHKGEMCGKVHVTLSEQKATADISVPLEDKIPGGEGRYFVGQKITSIIRTDNKAFFVRSALLAGDESDSAFPIMDFGGTVKVNESGAVDVEAKAAEVFGWVASDAFVERFLEGMNMVEGMFQCPHFKKHAKDALTFIEDINIEDGKLVISVRPQTKKDGGNTREVGVNIGMRNLLRAKNL